MARVRNASGGGPAPEDLLGGLGRAFDNVGKVIAGVAALGGLAYLIALLATALRLRDAGLPSHEVLSAIPRDQLLVGGTIELLASLVVAAVLVGLAFVSRRSLVAQLVLISALLVTLPFSLYSLWWLLTTGLLVLLVRFWAPPIAVVLAVFALAAIVLTLLRQAEFPSPFAGATVALKAEAGAGAEAIRLPPISGKYIGSTSNEILVGVKGAERRAVEKLLQGARVPDSLVMIPRARIDQVVLTSQPGSVKPPASLAARLGVPVTCLIPTCRVGRRELVTPS